MRRWIWSRFRLIIAFCSIDLSAVFLSLVFMFSESICLCWVFQHDPSLPQGFALSIWKLKILFLSFCNKRRYSDLGKFQPVEIHVCQNCSWGAVKRGHVKLTQGIASLLFVVSHRFRKPKLTGHCQLNRHFHALFFKWAFCRWPRITECITFL